MTDKRAEVVEKVRRQADDLVHGRRDGIDLKHLDAVRLVSLFDEQVQEIEKLKVRVESNWERSKALEAHIETLGSTTEAALTAYYADEEEAEGQTEAAE